MRRGWPLCHHQMITGEFSDFGTFRLFSTAGDRYVFIEPSQAVMKTRLAFAVFRHDVESSAWTPVAIPRAASRPTG